MSRPTLLNSLFRRLLLMDKPVPAHTPESFAAEVSRNYRWNFAFNLLDGASFSFGQSFMSATTIVPLFVSKLSDSPFAISLAVMIAQGGWYLPQLFTSKWVERLPRKKPVVVNLGFFTERVPMVLIVTAALLALPGSSAGASPNRSWFNGSTLALILFLIGYAWHNLGAGVVGTAWQNLIARCFPVNRRGRFFGMTQFVGTGTGAMAAIFCAWLLGRLPFPTNFACAFALAALFISLSWVFLAFTREPIEPIARRPHSDSPYLAQLPQILRRNANYRRFLIARVMLSLGAMGTGFITVAAVGRWNLPDSVAGYFTGAFLLGQTIGNLTFGCLADRFGHKLSLELSALLAALAFTTAWLAPSPLWFPAAFCFAGASYGAVVVSGLLVVFEFCTPDKMPTYTGLTNTMVGLTNITAPLIGAWLTKLGYSWLFATSAAVSVAALLLMRYWVHEPRWAKAQAAPAEEYAVAADAQ